MDFGSGPRAQWQRSLRHERSSSACAFLECMFSGKLPLRNTPEGAVCLALPGYFGSGSNGALTAPPKLLTSLAGFFLEEGLCRSSLLGVVFRVATHSRKMTDPGA